ncbi:hypothetical protein [Streptomyces resistomycificus]|uniref:Lipoprotein n=1 Tax=Streptomyces resistomycificus TaxID=67356 RepID=A0A0L8L105_9ACTN|nr:hypothetical protein [Streptomyces resistomycificus]KOG31933.1 lipoprotein [Streptomyces resistomycificus]KUN93447.1 hypothetical protein AQJ84_29250 [Streptomyces resistomycificus]
MPYPPPPRTPSGPRRRTLLASAAGSALLVGCSSGSGESDGGTGGSPSAAQRARARAAGESTDLVDRYDAVIAVHPALAARLAPLRAEVVRHARAFGAAGQASARASEETPGTSGASPSAAPSASRPAAGPPDVPVDEKDALAELAAAERSVADRRAKALLGVPGELARLLASVAAAGAAHAYLLTEGAR